MEEDALDFLTSVAEETTLRYGIQLITTSSLLAAKRKAGEVGVEFIQCLLRQIHERFDFILVDANVWICIASV